MTDYTFDSDGNFCVGNTTLDTMFKVSVMDYGVSLPEVHATGPLITPQSVRVSAIINWIERGLCVDFVSKSDEEKVLYFVLAYNKYAKEVNNEAQSVKYKLALVAQKWLILDLHWQGKLDDTKRSETSANPFVKRQHVNSYNQPKAVYNNDTIRAKFSKKKKENQFQDAIKSQLESHDYDIFSSQPQDLDEMGNPLMNDMDLVLES